jgi:adenylyltransferase/sulfurtransferase
VASLQVSECLRFLTGGPTQSGELVYFDTWEGSHARTKLARYKECPTCQKGEYPSLKAREGASVNTLCGRNTVMITYYQPRHINLTALAKKLESIGRTEVSQEMIMFHIDTFSLAIFPDGRAVIKGTEDPNEARALYSKYIGN